MSQVLEWYVEYKVVGFASPVIYRQGPYDYANALIHRDDIWGFEGVYDVRLVKAGSETKEAVKL